MIWKTLNKLPSNSTEDVKIIMLCATRLMTLKGIQNMT